MLEFGEPVGYTLKGENYAPDFILEALIEAQKDRPDFVKRVTPIMNLMYRPTEVALRELALIFGFDYDDERSWSDAEFPKPLFLEQLQCGDRDWTDLAPDHQWEPISLPKKLQTCRWCGKEREA